MENKRTLRDLNLAKSSVLPAANANNATASIDTASENPGRTGLIGEFEILIELPATPSLVDAKTITLKVQDSADNVTFADVADLPAVTTVGVATSQGGPAVERRFTPPHTLRRYIRMYQAVENGGGSNIAITGTISLVK